MHLCPLKHIYNPNCPRITQGHKPEHKCNHPLPNKSESSPSRINDRRYTKQPLSNQDLQLAECHTVNMLCFQQQSLDASKFSNTISFSFLPQHWLTFEYNAIICINQHFLFQSNTNSRSQNHYLYPIRLAEVPSMPAAFAGAAQGTVLKDRSQTPPVNKKKSDHIILSKSSDPIIIKKTSSVKTEQSQLPLFLSPYQFRNSRLP